MVCSGLAIEQSVNNSAKNWLRNLIMADIAIWADPILLTLSKILREFIYALFKRVQPITSK